jgi:serine/threonine-protein kinase RsbW
VVNTGVEEFFSAPEEGDHSVNPADGTIELTIPPDARYLRLVRLVASGLASTAGFNVDELDDLRIAVDEAVTALLEGGNGTKVPLTFEVKGGQVAMTAQTEAREDAPLDADRLELSTQILAAVCDEHELQVADGAVQVRICRRAGGR